MNNPQITFCKMLCDDDNLEEETSKTEVNHNLKLNVSSQFQYEKLIKLYSEAYKKKTISTKRPKSCD